ncbi:Maf family protein [Pseudemcibacter aquimaris]|uniref:Maf family protein n=1 Tax=Pseudemcibacter aquimaris TaxID=2857064 RepID=UPI0020133ECB|nr:Maf family protein [Pseudemcibacter aquimaris]MCC3861827.1 Maf family protein [Pseudemcibacter aquimaris]WDU58582.1 Maf family protein [Pseudemcibacter aquimaris]
MGLILASKSASRKKILENTGLSFETKPAPIDEQSIKEEMLSTGDNVRNIAERLASEKALYVLKDHPEDFILGADQILSCDGHLFSKARDKNEAKEHLEFFRGKKHTLTTSIVLAKADKIIWVYTCEPELTMRDFSEAFLNDYMEKAGDALIHSVGCYYMEDIGIQLFSEIKGEYYDILGLPLLPLLKKLRDLKIIND